MALFQKRNYNGITKKTVENLQLDAGAFFKNFIIGEDTYASAKEAGKIIGATDGGGSFRAVATIRQITVDGAGTRVKGFANVDGWEVSLGFTLKEMTTAALKDALGLADVNKDESTKIEGYDVITGRMSIEEGDFIENVTWVGCLSGSDKPIYIQLTSGFNEDGLTFNMQDKSEGSISCTFYGYNSLEEYMNDEVKPPFKIYRPLTTSDTAAANAQTTNTEATNENEDI